MALRPFSKEAGVSQHWSEKELSGIDLGDARLNKRSVKLLERLGDKPTASIPAACKGWAETYAAYRFFAQEEIGWEDILAPHFKCTLQRMKVDRWCCVFRTPPS